MASQATTMAESKIATRNSKIEMILPEESGEAQYASLAEDGAVL